MPRLELLIQISGILHLGTLIGSAQVPRAKVSRAFAAASADVASLDSDGGRLCGTELDRVRYHLTVVRRGVGIRVTIGPLLLRLCGDFLADSLSRRIHCVRRETIPAKPFSHDWLLRSHGSLHLARRRLWNSRNWGIVLIDFQPPVRDFQSSVGE